MRSNLFIPDREYQCPQALGTQEYSLLGIPGRFGDEAVETRDDKLNGSLHQARAQRNSPLLLVPEFHTGWPQPRCIDYASRPWITSSPNLEPDRLRWTWAAGGAVSIMRRTLAGSLALMSPSPLRICTATVLESITFVLIRAKFHSLQNPSTRCSLITRWNTSRITGAHCKKLIEF